MELTGAIEFNGSRASVKNTFFHFEDCSRVDLRTPRGKSAPARTRHIVAPVAPSPLDASGKTAEQSSLTHSIHIGSGIKRMDEEAILTVMIRGIPCGCSREEILQAVEELGFTEYEFFYAPTRRGKTLGYAFLGFPYPHIAENFTRSMTGYRFRHRESAKTVTVTPASIQGFSNNLAHFSSTSVMQSIAKPLFSQQGSL